MAQDYLLNIRLDLRHWIGQFVVGVVDLLRAHAILHGNRNSDEHVVFGLRLHGQSDLIYAQTDRARYGVEERSLPVQSGLGNAKELAESRDHSDFGRTHGEKASQDKVEHNESDNSHRNP